MRLLIGLLLTMLCVMPANAERVVHVWNWTDYIDPQTLKDFEKETGIRVVYDTFDNNEIVQTKLLAGKSGYDVVVRTATFLAQEIQAGLYQKLDKALLSNLSYQWPQIVEQTSKYDPSNAYSVNYMWGTSGIGYNREKISSRMPQAPVDKWQMVFNPEIISKFQDCGIHMLDSPEDLIPHALRYLGLSPQSRKSEDLDKAASVLRAIKPYVQKFHSSEFINALANGEICLAVGYSGDIFQARNRAKEAKNGIDIAYTIPSEGALMWFDQMAIPSDAPHVTEAHAFINYMQRPEVIARNSTLTNYANGNLASQKLIAPSVINDKNVYPDKEMMERLFTVPPPTPSEQRILTRLWTKVKTGY